MSKKNMRLGSGGVSRASLSLSGLGERRGAVLKHLFTAVLDSSAVADSPLEVSLRVGLDEGVNGSNVSLAVATTTAGGRDVLVITADADQLRGCVLN